MLEHIKNEMHAFINDIDQNVKDEEALIYIKDRTEKLIDYVADEIEKIIDFKTEKLNAIIKKQELEDLKIKELNEKMDMLFEDIYEQENEDFSINCPYCNNEFEAIIDEEINEIHCPECGNIIELDWNGNPDDDNKGCSGNCSGCGGCK